MLVATVVVCVSLTVVLRMAQGLGRNPLGGILLHLLVEPLLVLLCHLLVLCLLSHNEGLPALTKDNNHVNKLDAGVFLHDLGTRAGGEVVISAS